MNDVLAPIKAQSETADGRSRKGTVTGKLKVAIDLMLYEGSSRPDAARQAGLADHSLRTAMRKAHVLRYYNQGLEVLRTSERPRNIRRLAEIRDKSNGMPAVQAIARLEQLAEHDSPRAPGGPQMPGLVVVVNALTVQSRAPMLIDETIPPVAFHGSRPVPKR